MLNKQFKTKAFGPSARCNEKIQAPEVRVIGNDGKQLGIMSAAQALAEARAQGLDLVEIAPKALPPVVKIINFDKFRYQQNKQMQAQRKHQKTIEVKGIRLSVRTGIHDMEFKARATDKFLKAGNKVKIDLMLRGREKINIGYAIEQVKKLLGLITAPHVVEIPPKRMGNMINAFLSPK